MGNTQDSNSNGEAAAGEGVKGVAENKISATPEKDALVESSLDKVSGGGWPYATMGTAQVSPTI
jgi:hypothetical protein